MHDSPPQVLREYALLADGHRGVLVGPHGDCAWLCFPGFADDAVFATLIGGGGYYTVRPDRRYVWGGYYDDASLIWNSRWMTDRGAVECREALVYHGEPDRAVLLRRLRAIDDEVPVCVTLDPMADYGRRRMGRWRQEADHWELHGCGMVLRWWGADTATDDRGHLTMRLDVTPDRPHDLVLELTTDQRAASGGDAPTDDAEFLWRRTQAAWQAEVPACDDVIAARDVRRSYAVLRGMTSPEGGTVAAATTSLPERAGGSRNYDYRYVWIRDTCYIGRAGARLQGGERMLDDAVRWVSRRLLADADDLAPAYRADGSPVPPERQLDLPGYPGGSDVVGNRAHNQFQLDAFGEALLLFAEAARCDRLDAPAWEAAHRAAQAIDHHWKDPESGVWELDPRVWAHSRLICAAGLQSLCTAGAPQEWSNRFLPLANAIVSQVSADCLHSSGRWQRAVDDERVDAALLLAQIRGAIGADDPRSRATLAAIAAELAEDHYGYRYREPSVPLGDNEGAFLICNFWMALALADIDDLVESARWFERARTSCGPPGLLAEEFDVVQRQMRGNLPQAFVHALLIETASRLRGARSG
jgi:GH15 family glucan-1,4-alpha-glucosidase